MALNLQDWIAGIRGVSDQTGGIVKSVNAQRDDQAKQAYLSNLPDLLRSGDTEGLAAGAAQAGDFSPLNAYASQQIASDAAPDALTADQLRAGGFSGQRADLLGSIDDLDTQAKIMGQYNTMDNQALARQAQADARRQAAQSHSDSMQERADNRSDRLQMSLNQQFNRDPIVVKLQNQLDGVARAKTQLNQVEPLKRSQVMDIQTELIAQMRQGASVAASQEEKNEFSSLEQTLIKSKEFMSGKPEDYNNPAVIELLHHMADRLQEGYTQNMSNRQQTIAKDLHLNDARAQALVDAKNPGIEKKDVNKIANKEGMDVAHNADGSSTLSKTTTLSGLNDGVASQIDQFKNTDPDIHASLIKALSAQGGKALTAEQQDRIIANAKRIAAQRKAKMSGGQ